MSETESSLSKLSSVKIAAPAEEMFPDLCHTCRDSFHRSAVRKRPFNNVYS